MKTAEKRGDNWRARHGTSSGFTPRQRYFAEFVITVPPNQPLVWIEESQETVEGDAWVFDAVRGWWLNAERTDLTPDRPTDESMATA